MEPSSSLSDERQLATDILSADSTHPSSDEPLPGAGRSGAAAC